MQTVQEQQDSLVANAYHREMEIDSYQTNINNYTQMLIALPQGDWPENLVDFKILPIESLPVTMSDIDVQAVADYQFRDKLRGLLRTERVEQSKATRIKDAIKSQITGDYNALLAAYKASLIPPMV